MFTFCHFIQSSALRTISLSAPEPMQVDTYHLTPTERLRRIQQLLCLYCGGEGHVLATCPISPPRLMRKPSSTQVPPGTSSVQRILQELNVRRRRCFTTLHIHTIQGKPLGRSRVRHFSPTLTLRTPSWCWKDPQRTSSWDARG